MEKEADGRHKYMIANRQNVDELNAFQPAILGGYPSNLEKLIEKQKNGKIHLEPMDEVTVQEVFDKAKSALEGFFSIHGLTEVDNYSIFMESSDC